MSNNNNMAQLVTESKPDAEIAKELKAKMIQVLQPVLKVMDEAKEDGFVLTFNLGPDFMGRHNVMVLQLSKLF